MRVSFVGDFLHHWVVHCLSIIYVLVLSFILRCYLAPLIYFLIFFFIILRILLRIYYRLLLLKNSHLWIVFFFFPFFLYLVLFFSSWIRGCLLAIFAILVNGNAKGWVKTSRGLRQRDPPFPFLSFPFHHCSGCPK